MFDIIVFVYNIVLSGAQLKFQQFCRDETKDLAPLFARFPSVFRQLFDFSSQANAVVCVTQRAFTFS